MVKTTGLEFIARSLRANAVTIGYELYTYCTIAVVSDNTLNKHISSGL